MPASKSSYTLLYKKQYFNNITILNNDFDICQSPKTSLFKYRNFGNNIKSPKPFQQLIQFQKHQITNPKEKSKYKLNSEKEITPNYTTTSAFSNFILDLKTPLSKI